MLGVIKSVDYAWLSLLGSVLDNGFQQTVRGLKTIETLDSSIVIDMRYSLMTIVGRKINYAYLFAEPLWILNGGNKVDEIKPYIKNMEKYSDDGITFVGAYGPKIFEQLEYVVKTLIEDMTSRRAVINVWRENPKKTKDYTSTTSLNFLIRQGRLHCFAEMRSSDCWLGLPYDLFTESMIAFYIMLRIREAHPYLELGSLYNHAHSRHIYVTDIHKATELLYQEANDKRARLTNFFAPFDAYRGNEHYRANDLLFDLNWYRDDAQKERVSNSRAVSVCSASE